MRAFFFSVALATGAVASVLPRQNSDGPSVRNDIPVFNTHLWPLLNPTEALSALHQKATETPSAVDILPGVPLPTNWHQLVQGIEHGLQEGLESLKLEATQVTEGWLEENVAKPENIKPLPHQVPKNPPTEEASKVAEEAAAATSACTNPETHYEWDNLTAQQQQAFVDAIKCLFSAPARSGIQGTQTRWDDLAAIHQHMSPTIHNVGQFLPWHRYFLKILENEMRGTCGYTGPMAWWDETKNAGNFSAASLATQQYFGDFPNGNTVCITSGVFANTELRIGPGQTDSNHCLSRGVNEALSADITTNFVNTCNSYNDYEDMNNCVFFGPHAYGHDSMGGVMADVDSSPGDPVFFMHHAFVDHNYRIWQRANPSNRTYQIGGFTTQNCDNDCQPTELNYVLSSMNFYPSVTIQQVADTEGGYLCYKYDY